MLLSVPVLQTEMKVRAGNGAGGNSSWGAKTRLEFGSLVLFLLLQLLSDQGLRNFYEESWILLELFPAEISGHGKLSCCPFPQILCCGCKGPTEL